MFVSTVFARFGRRNRLFVQNATKREKKRDWLAVDTVYSELVLWPNSLLTGKYTGNMEPLIRSLGA